MSSEGPPILSEAHTGHECVFFFITATGHLATELSYHFTSLLLLLKCRSDGFFRKEISLREIFSPCFLFLLSMWRIGWLRIYQSKAYILTSLCMLPMTSFHSFGLKPILGTEIIFCPCHVDGAKTMWLFQQCINSSDIGSFEEFGVCNEVTSVNTAITADAIRMALLDDLYSSQ